MHRSVHEPLWDLLAPPPSGWTVTGMTDSDVADMAVAIYQVTQARQRSAPDLVHAVRTLVEHAVVLDDTLDTTGVHLPVLSYLLMADTHTLAQPRMLAAVCEPGYEWNAAAIVDALVPSRILFNVAQLTNTDQDTLEVALAALYAGETLADALTLLTN